MKVNYDKYRKLINDDAKWLVDNIKDSSERRHILKVLWDSIECYYPDAPSQCINTQDANRGACPECEIWFSLGQDCPLCHRARL